MVRRSPSPAGCGARRASIGTCCAARRLPARWVEPQPHLRPVSRAVVDQLPANLKANWLLRSSQEQDELSERAYLAAISLAMVEASDAE